MAIHFLQNGQISILHARLLLLRQLIRLSPILHRSGKLHLVQGKETITIPTAHLFSPGNTVFERLSFQSYIHPESLLLSLVRRPLAGVGRDLLPSDSGDNTFMGVLFFAFFPQGSVYRGSCSLAPFFVVILAFGRSVRLLSFCLTSL